MSDAMESKLLATGFEVQKMEDGNLIVGKHGAAAMIEASEAHVTILEFSAATLQRDAGRLFMIDLAAVATVVVEDVGRPPREGEAADADQKFWAAMAREGLVTAMAGPDGKDVSADEIDPPRLSRGP